MREYQYYEWQTVDHLLTDAEQAAVGSLSSHIDVSASQAVVTYDWGDFKHDSRQVLARYFDAHLYFANWGTRVLMFRFPRGLLDEQALAPYLVDELISLSTAGESQILEFTFELEREWEWVEDEDGSLSRLVSLRNDVLAGDYRRLYLGWLKALTLQDPDVQTHWEEPPVPPGLNKLVPALDQLVAFLDLDQHLITSAAAASPAKATTTSDAALRKAIGQLSRAESDEFLYRLLQGEPGLNFALRHRLRAELRGSDQPAGGGRTAAELLTGAKRAKRQDAERKAAEAEKHRIAALEKLAKTEDKAWQTVEAQLADRHWTYQAKAVEQLRQLRDLADYRHTRTDFNRKMRKLRTKHQGRPSILKRFDQAELP